MITTITITIEQASYNELACTLELHYAYGADAT